MDARRRHCRVEDAEDEPAIRSTNSPHVSTESACWWRYQRDRARLIRRVAGVVVLTVCCLFTCSRQSRNEAVKGKSEALPT